jgi:hypothetical protein
VKIRPHLHSDSTSQNPLEKTFPLVGLIFSGPGGNVVDADLFTVLHGVRICIQKHVACDVSTSEGDALISYDGDLLRGEAAVLSVLQSLDYHVSEDYRRGYGDALESIRAAYQEEAVPLSISHPEIKHKLTD